MYIYILQSCFAYRCSIFSCDIVAVNSLSSLCSDYLSASLCPCLGLYYFDAKLMLRWNLYRIFLEVNMYIANCSVDF